MIEYSQGKYIISCDICCDGPQQGFISIVNVLDYFKQHQWKSVLSHIGCLDFCPFCAEEKKAS